MNIFVGNLNTNLDERALRTIFKEYGEIKSLTITKDLYTHRSRGYGFVEMWQDNDGLAAIEKLNNKNFLGKRIVVSKAKPDYNK